MSSVPRLETVVNNTIYFDDGSVVSIPKNVVVPRIFNGLEELVTEPSRWLFHREGEYPGHGWPLYEGAPITAVQAVLVHLASGPWGKAG